MGLTIRYFRDCSDENIMFDGAGMYPKGFHAILWNFDANGNQTTPRRRRDVPAVKYYFTDFGISSRFQDGKPHLVTGTSGLDREVPELLHLSEYDPFPVDVFILGNVFKHHFVEVRDLLFSGLRLTVPAEILECAIFITSR